MPNHNRHAILLILAVLLAPLSLAACSSSAGPLSTASPPASPSQSPVPSTSPSAPPSASVSPEPSASQGSVTVTSSRQAVDLVKAKDARFADLNAYDANLIGQCCWYQVRQVEGGYEVDIRLGWGDCPSGCINEHHWKYAVAPDGRVGLISQGGDEVPPGFTPGGFTGEG